MTIPYYVALYAAYAVALTGWWGINRSKPEVWPSGPPHPFDHPWREVLWAVLAAVATILIGQLLYVPGHLLPEASVTDSPLAASLNQIIIFSPFLILLAIRRQPLTTAWLPGRHLPLRIAAGVALALLAIFTLVTVRGHPGAFPSVLADVYRPANLGYATQIFLEDIALAVALVRFRSALGGRRFVIAVLVVAFAFSAAHYPLKLSGGLSFFAATLEVLIDGALAAAIIYVLQRSRDIVWFWFVHFALDMMQFYAP